MPVRIVFETHSTSEDNEAGIATGWLPGRLSELGRRRAVELGARRRDDRIHTVFCSDLDRAIETASIAFGGSGLPILLDWRLRECDFGAKNGSTAAEVQSTRADHVDHPYPGGESWREAVSRVGRFLRDLPVRWDSKRILVIGHRSTYFALQHFLGGTPLDELVRRDFVWQEGWEYELPSG